MGEPTNQEKPQITICGLGPGGERHLTEETVSAFETIERRYLRTAVHPSAHRVGTSTTFDYAYEAADTFEQVYDHIAAALIDAAQEHQQVLYAVPGSPRILEQSVAKVVKAASEADLTVRVLPAVSFLDQAWVSLGIDPVEENVRLIDGHRFATAAAGQTGPLLVAHTHADWVLSQVKLSLDPADDPTVLVCQSLGTPEEKIIEVPWSELDRVEADHLTSLYIPKLAEPVGYELQRTVQLMQTLRADCPWDREQTHSSLRKYLVEESYEVLDVLEVLHQSATATHPETEQLGAATNPDLNETYADLEEELGDLWFQILFHAQLAQEQGQFTIADVARTLYDKMVTRHPHVFSQTGEGVKKTVPDQSTWDEQKKKEKDRKSVLDGIPVSLPSLASAAKVISRSRQLGSAPDLDHARRVLSEQELVGADQAEATLGSADEVEAYNRAVGQHILAVVALAHSHGVDAELAVRQAVERAMAAIRQSEGNNQDPGANWFLG